MIDSVGFKDQGASWLFPLISAKQLPAQFRNKTMSSLD